MKNLHIFFAKFTKHKTDPGIIKHIFNLNNTEDSYEKVLYNEYYNLSDDCEFSDFISRIVKYQKNINSNI